MKKIYLALVFSLALFSDTSASHLMGGQITSRNLGGLNYEVTLTAYRDTSGVSMYTTALIHYIDSVSGWSHVAIVALSAPTSIGNGVEMYTYIDTITFPATGNYYIWFQDCCRNAAILNMANADVESFHLNNSLWADTTNSSPVFQNIPITVAQVGVPFSYNPLPMDADGDSISWILDTPLSDNALPVVGYVLPYSDSLVPFTLDSVTGEITFLPNTLGNFQLSMRVIEYRNGVEIGFIRRDMQILIVPSVNQPLRLTLTSPNAPYSGKNFTVSPNSNFSFTCVANDPDMGSPLMIASGEAFGHLNAPVFTVTRANGYTTGTLTWTPDQSQQRPLPYLFSLRTIDAYGIHTFSSDVTLRLHVNNTTGIVKSPEQGILLNVYPNPVTAGELSLSFHSNAAEAITIDIMSVTGQTLKTMPDAVHGDGDHVVNIRDLAMASGIYLVRLSQNGQQIGATRFTVK